MALYRWEGINRIGKSVKGMLETASEENVREALLAQDIALLTCTLAHKNSLLPVKLFQRHVTQAQLYEFFDQLSLLIINGIELIKALDVIAKGASHAGLKAVITTIIKDIRHGASFHSALQKQPVLFQPFIVQLVATGETTGTLGPILEYLANSLKQTLELREELKKAALQPLITLGISLMLVWGMFVFILPRFQALYQSLNCPLPAVTRKALAVSSFLSSWYGLIAIISIIIMGTMLMGLLRHPFLKRACSWVALHIPLISCIIIYTEQIQFMQTIRLFLSSGLPLMQALEQARQSAHNYVFKTKIDSIIHDVTHGTTLSQALTNTGKPFFNDTLIALVDVGEHSGILATVLTKAQQSVQQQRAQKLTMITTLFSPLLMVFVGLLIGSLMVIMYLPVFNLGNLWKP